MPVNIYLSLDTRFNFLANFKFECLHNVRLYAVYLEDKKFKSAHTQ